MDKIPDKEKLKPVRNEIDYIYNKMDIFEDEERGKSFEENPFAVQAIVEECAKKLNLIKDTLGEEDSDYLEICDFVVDSGIRWCTAYLLSGALKATNTFGRDYKTINYFKKGLLNDVEAIYETTSKLHMSPSNKKQFNESLELYKECRIAQNKSGCYIATMVYGSYDASEVIALRRFRDEVLLKSWIGQRFVEIYYKYSPAFVEKTKNMKIIHLFLKLILSPFVKYIKTTMI